MVKLLPILRWVILQPIKEASPLALATMLLLVITSLPTPTCQPMVQTLQPTEWISLLLTKAINLLSTEPQITTQSKATTC